MRALVDLAADPPAGARGQRRHARAVDQRLAALGVADLDLDKTLARRVYGDRDLPGLRSDRSPRRRPRGHGLPGEPAPLAVLYARRRAGVVLRGQVVEVLVLRVGVDDERQRDRKSTRLNSSHV